LYTLLLAEIHTKSGYLENNNLEFQLRSKTVCCFTERPTSNNWSVGCVVEYPGSATLCWLPRMGYALSVRDSMMIAHSFKGKEFGPAQNVRTVLSIIASPVVTAQLTATELSMYHTRANERVVSSEY
jgi:hypothetical protein